MSIIGQRLDERYQILELLASGGFGQTYIAEDTKRPKHPKCVVKQLKPPSRDPKTVQVARRLFQKEAEILDTLGQHPQIPQLFAYFEVEGEFYLVQELIEGTPLTEEIQPGYPLSEAQVQAFLTESLELMVYVHAQGVIHRDIKPSNFLRRQSDHKLILIDFGAVKEVTTQVVDGQGQVTSTIAIGTPGYMPLEQFHSNPQFNSDLYALGMVAIQALTGMEAHELSSLRDPDNPSAGEILWRNLVTINPELGNTIDKMVRTNFRQRYHSAKDVLADLQPASAPREDGATRLQGQQRTSVQGASAKTQSQTSSALTAKLRGKLGLTLAGTAILFGLGTGGWWFLNRNNAAQSEQRYQDAITKYERDDFRGALQDLDRAIQLNSRNGLAYYYRGLTQEEAGDYPAAIEDLGQAIEHLPQGKTVGGGIGVIYEIPPGQPFPIVVSVSDRSPAMKAGLQAKDQIVSIAGQSTENLALQGVTDLLAGEPGTTLTLTFAREGSPQEASLTRVAIPNRQLALAYFHRSRLYYREQQFQPANEDGTRAIEIDDENFLYYSIRGAARSRLGEKQAAVQDFTKALALNPKDFNSLLERGRIRRFLGQRSDAIEDFSQAAQLNPSDVFTHYELCVTRSLVNDHQGALADCDRAVATDPRFPSAYLARGSVNRALGNTQAALADFARAIEIDPDSHEPYTGRGVLRAKAGDPQGAIEDFTQAIRLYPKDSEAYNNRGIVRNSLKDYSGALQDFDKAIENNPNNAGAYTNRARTHLALGQKDQAQADLKQAAQLFLEQKRLQDYERTLAVIRDLEQSN